MRSKQTQEGHGLTQWVQVVIYYIHRPKSKDIGTALRPRYIPYSYIDSLGYREPRPLPSGVVVAAFILGGSVDLVSTLGRLW